MWELNRAEYTTGSCKFGITRHHSRVYALGMDGLAPSRCYQCLLQSATLWHGGKEGLQVLNQDKPAANVECL